MLKQVFWLDQNKFVCNLIEATLKKEGVSCYTHQTGDGFRYLIEDIKPDLVVIDFQSISHIQEKIDEELSTCTCPVILSLKEEERSLVKLKKNNGSLSKPIEPMILADNLKALLNEVN